jgi:hypothetical protein
MIRALCWILGIEALMRRLDRRPSPTAHLPPIRQRLAIHIHDAERTQQPISPSPFL